MKTIAKIVMVSFLLTLLPGAINYLFAQEAESNAVGFVLNNAPKQDKEPPAIKVISPTIKEGDKYVSELEEVDLIGEVTDDNKIRFVSVNTDIRMPNETGIFAYTLRLDPGENVIQLRAMDEHNNLRSIDMVIDYQPPVVTLADRIKSESKYYGLFIGIEDYTDPGIPNLDNPIDDAEKLYNTLTRKYTFEKDNIHILKNPTRKEIINELDNLRGRVTENDNLLIYYAGHGYWDEAAGIGYWLPKDAVRGSTVDWFRNSTLVDYLQAIQSKHTLLITDACFAGSIFKARSVNLEQEMVYETLYDLPSRKAMVSGNLEEVPDQSAFLKYLIQRLDENRKEYLSSEELFSLFRLAVISNSNGVIPQIGEIYGVGNQGGDFIFVKRDQE